MNIWFTVNNKEILMISTEVLIKILIFFVLTSFILTTIKAVINGIKEGYMNACEIYRGSSYDQVRNRYLKKKDKDEEQKLKKMDSRFYRFMHPLEWINFILLKKVKERLGL